MKRSFRFPPQMLLAGMLLLALAMTGRAAFAQAQMYGEPRFDPPALDSMLAPVALYPDPLLSQVLMAATYPQEVADAARWLQEHPGLSGDAAVRSAEGWDWDPSVQSLLAFPMVLQTLAEYPSWTNDLGEAFLVQREDVMDAIQRLRRRALAAGTLRSSEYTRVVDTGYGVAIETVSPEDVYVPYYDPRVAYGTWWWSNRPPMYWSRWPGYRVPPGRDHFIYWGPGVRIGTGFFFGNFVWPRREVRIVDVRPYYYSRPVAPGRPFIERRPSAPDIWRHDSHRRNAAPQRDGGRPQVVVPRQAPIPQPRGIPPGHQFDDGHDRRAPREQHAPRSERRDFDRRDFDRRNFDRRDFDRNDANRREPLAAPPRAPAAAVAPPAQPSSQRGQGEFRSGSRPEFRRDERRGDEGRARQPAVQAPVTPPASASPPPQRFRDANEEHPVKRRPREARD